MAAVYFYAVAMIGVVAFFAIGDLIAHFFIW